MFPYYGELTQFSIYTSLYLVINSNNWETTFFFTVSNPKNVSQETFFFWAEMSKDILNYVFKGKILKSF